MVLVRFFGRVHRVQMPRNRAFLLKHEQIGSETRNPAPLSVTGRVVCDSLQSRRNPPSPPSRARLVNASFFRRLVVRTSLCCWCHREARFCLCAARSHFGSVCCSACLGLEKRYIYDYDEDDATRGAQVEIWLVGSGNPFLSFHAGLSYIKKK